MHALLITKKSNEEHKQHKNLFLNMYEKLQLAALLLKHIK